MSQDITPGQAIDFSGSSSGQQQISQSDDTNQQSAPQDVPQNNNPVTNSNSNSGYTTQQPSQNQYSRPQPAMSPTSFADLEDEEDDDIFPPATPPMGQQKFGRPPMTMAGASAQPSLSKMTEDQRREAITRVFKLVLGRDPIEKDFNYYRFSALTEDGLIRNLLNLAEHKTIIDNAKESPSLKSRTNELELKAKLLESNLESLQNELRTLQEILREKNRYIQSLRRSLESFTGSMFPEQNDDSQDMNFINTPQQNTQPQYQQYTPQYQQPVTEQMYEQPPQNIRYSNPQPLQTNKLASPLDELKNIFKGLFNRR
jgi:hypothetical protein